MDLFLIILVSAILLEMFSEKPDCNCPLDCERHKVKSSPERFHLTAR
jgi:hypothetical protein